MSTWTKTLVLQKVFYTIVHCNGWQRNKVTFLLLITFCTYFLKCTNFKKYNNQTYFLVILAIYHNFLLLFTLSQKLLAEGLLAYFVEVVHICNYIPQIYKNTLHSWKPKNILGCICKKISGHSYRWCELVFLQI